MQVGEEALLRRIVEVLVADEREAARSLSSGSLCGVGGARWFPVVPPAAEGRRVPLEAWHRFG